MADCTYGRTVPGARAKLVSVSPPSSHGVGNRAVELRALVQWWQMGYQIEAKEISDVNSMRDLLLSDENDV